MQVNALLFILRGRITADKHITDVVVNIFKFVRLYREAYNTIATIGCLVESNGVHRFGDPWVLCFCKLKNIYEPVVDVFQKYLPPNFQNTYKDLSILCCCCDRQSVNVIKVIYRYT